MRRNSSKLCENKLKISIKTKSFKNSGAEKYINWNGNKNHHRDSKSDVKAEESISELENRTMKIKYEEQKEKSLKESKESLRDL